jgi:peroxiredoxin Q/BCP
LNAQIFGVSLDSRQKNLKFAEKYQFPYSLLSDESGEFAKACGAIDVLGQKKAARITYIVDPKLNVVKSYRVQFPGKHPAVVLEDLKSVMRE